jgi:GT2 family glycosyltransferase
LLIVLDESPPRLSGFAAITGWAIAKDAPVTHVDLFVRGRWLAGGRPTERRSDIRVRFPHYRWRGHAGFRLAPQPGVLSEGVHELVVRARDSLGRITHLKTTLVVDDYRLADLGDLPEHLRGSDREYQAWCASRPAGISNEEIEDERASPVVSVVMPVYRPQPQQLREAIDSVRQQTYPRWQLCLCDDGSRQDELSQYLWRLCEEEPRIRLVELGQNQGISAATNTAIGLGTGDYVAFLDQDDRIAPHALASVAAEVKRRKVDLLYSDWDRIDAHGCRIEPFFKPDWSSDLLNSMMYVAHLTVYRRAFLERIGLCRSEFDGTQDWELALRATAQTDKIVHLPQVLYHWRIGGLSAGSFNRVCHERGRRAITERLGRNPVPGLTHEVADAHVGCTFHVRYRWDRWPLVSILIPTRDNVRLLRRCLKSIQRLTTYPHYEVIVIDNGTRDGATRRFLRRCGARVLRHDGPFNHSRLNNLAAWASREARGELLLLLNDDTEVLTPEWLTALAEQALRPEVGAAGAWLLHPDGRTQHAGIVLGAGPVATPLHSGITRDGLDRGTVRLIRNVSAVTGACLMVRKEVYREVGGLDEDELPTSFNDVDFCLRLHKAGYRIVQQPLARLVHHESATRRIGDETAFIRLMHERWGERLTHDPYWNVNLGRGGGFGLAWGDAPVSHGSVRENEHNALSRFYTRDFQSRGFR